MRDILKTNWKCTSEGPQNNGRLKECNFKFAFENGFTPNCPTCGSSMYIQSDGPSVADLLRAGLQKEKANKKL